MSSGIADPPMQCHKHHHTKQTSKPPCVWWLAGRGGSGKGRLSGILGADDRAGSGAVGDKAEGGGDDDNLEEEPSVDSSMIRVVCSQRDR